MNLAHTILNNRINRFLVVETPKWSFYTESEEQ